eukprot:symbB.v1.2.035936.t2/scaffold4956.1/size32453/3
MSIPQEQEQSLPAVQVVVRIRPSLDSDDSRSELLSSGNGFVRLNAEDAWEDNIADRDCRRIRRPQEFRFSSVFGPSTTQEEVFSGLKMDQLITKVVEGYHATVFAYGQTGSGKTHTMEGYRYRAQADTPQVCIEETAPERLGVIPRALHTLFAKIKHLEESTESESFRLRISFLQIYQEKIYDLLNPTLFVSQGSEDGLRLRWDAVRGFFVENLFEYQCTSAEDALQYYHAGVQRKQMASTAMNIASSRSHSVLILSLLRRSQLDEDAEGPCKSVISNLTLVDLAGSEKAAATNESNAERFKEAVNINQSLFVLRRVITALSRNADEHVPYRESKLTSLLQHALGGKGFMVMLACLAPLDKYYEDNLSTLQYAAQAAMIKNEPVINVDPKDQLIEELRQQLHAAHEYILQQMNLEELPEELRTKVRHVKSAPSAPSCPFPSRRQDRGQKEDVRRLPRPKSWRSDIMADGFRKSASVSEVCQETKEKEKSQSADPEKSTRKRLPRTYSWDTRKDPNLHLQKQLKEAEAQTKLLEEQLQDALKSRRQSSRTALLEDASVAPFSVQRPVPDVVNWYCWCYAYLWNKPLTSEKLDELLDLAEECLELSFQSLELQGVLAENLSNPNASSRQSLKVVSALARSSNFPPEFKATCASICSKSSDTDLMSLTSEELVNAFNIHLCGVFDGPAALKRWLTEDASMKFFFQVHTSQKWYQKQDYYRSMFRQSDAYKSLREAAEKLDLDLRTSEPGEVYHLELVSRDAKERLATMSEKPPLAVICIGSKEQLRWYVPITARESEDLELQNRCRQFHYMFRSAVQKVRHAQTMGYRPCIIWLSDWKQLEGEAGQG